MGVESGYSKAKGAGFWRAVEEAHYDLHWVVRGLHHYTRNIGLKVLDVTVQPQLSGGGVDATPLYVVAEVVSPFRRGLPFQHLQPRMFSILSDSGP